MKRILSLFLSIVLVLSMCVCSVSFNAFAADEDKTMIEKTNVTIDMTNVTGFSATGGDYGYTGAIKIGNTKQHWLYLPRHTVGSDKNPAFTLSEDTTTFGTSVMKMEYVGSYAQFMPKGNITGSGTATTAVTGKRFVISGKHYQTAASQPAWKPAPNGTDYWIQGTLKANTWYDFEVAVNFNKNMVVTYTEILTEEQIAEDVEPHTSVTTCNYNSATLTYVRYTPRFAAGETVYFDDLKIYWEDTPFEKAEITNVGTNSVVTGGQNVVPVTLSTDIPAITKDHVTVTQKGTNQTISASDIEITSDGTNPVVNVTLASNLASWSEYTVTIDSLAFGDNCKQRTGEGDAEDVTDISKDFETSKPPFATKGFDYTVSGDNLNAKGLVVNTTGNPKDVKLVFSTFNSAGEQVEIAPTNYDDFNDSVGDYLEADVSTQGAEKFNFFIIDNWADKTPLLGVSANIDANGEAVLETAVSGGALSGTKAAISADELNHDNLKLSVRLDTKESAVVDGVLFVYKNGEDLSDSNLPIYAKAVSTAADGTLAVVIPLAQSLEYGEYTVEFTSGALAEALTDNFNYYTPEELLEARKLELLEDAKAATTAAGLKEILLGLNSADEQVNSNFDIFGADVDMTNYDAAYDRENIFTRMLSSVAALGDYEELVILFEEMSAAQVQYEIDNPTIMIESKVTTVADTRNTTTYGATTGTWSGTQALLTDGVKNTWFYLTNNGSEKKELYKITNDTSFGGSVAKLEAVYPNYMELFFGGKIPASADMTHNKLSGQSGTMEGRIRFTQDVSARVKFAPEGGNVGEQALGDLSADTWYNFKFEVVTGSHIKMTFTEVGSDTPAVSKKWNYTSNTFTYFRFYPGVSAGQSLYLDDVVVQYELIPFEKAKITAVGTDGVAEGYQNTLSFELSNKISGLTKDHISVTNKETNETIAAESITVSGNKVDVTLKSNLAGWSEYELTVDALAFGDTALQRVGRNELTEVTDLVAEFTTTKAPLAAKSFTFAKDGSVLNAKALVSNTTGSAKDMQFVFANFDKDGRIISIVPTEHSGFANGAEQYLEANTEVDDAKLINFFVIDDWSNKNPLFGANYNVNATGEVVTTTAASSGAIGTSGAAMELGDFDYENIKIAVKLDTKLGKVTDGILFVYKNGEVLSANNLPTYVKAVSTAADGTLSAEVLLPLDADYSAYTVEFVSDKLADSVSGTFRYYSPDEILANKRAAILADAKVATNAEQLMEVLMSVNSAGEKVNDNFDVFGKDAKTDDYNKNIDKLNVFGLMVPSLSGISSYDALVNLFETCASSQRANEVAAQKLQIVNDAKNSRNAQELMMVILGVDANGNKVNDNFDVIASNANMSVYNSLKNQAAVFNHMISSVKGISDYNDLIASFEAAARTQQSKEDVKPSASSNNSSYGGSSLAVKETVSTPAQSGNAGATVSNSVFNDVSGHWAQVYVEALYKRGIMKGYDDGSFRGNNSITRAEIAKTIVEAFAIASGEGNFADVAGDRWYSEYIASAAQAGIVTGFADGSFGPDMAVTRQDAALMIYRALSTKLKLPIGYTFFNDDLDIADYASGAIRTLGDLGIITGDENKKFKPNNSITRAEIATIICRALDYVESH